MTNGKRNRVAGHDWEKEVVALLRNRGIYPKAITTRQGSRALDALGIDAMNDSEETHGIMDDTIQCKNVSGGVNYHALIQDLIASGRPNPVVFHKRTSRREQNMVVQGHYCTTTLDNYLELMACRRVVKHLSAALSGRKFTGEELLQILEKVGL